MTQEQTRNAEGRSFLLVRSGDSSFALPLSIVQRVVRDLSYHAVPGAQPRLLGLAQFAGEPLPVLDLRATVEGESNDTRMRSTIIVSHRTRDHRWLLGLAVAEVLNVCEMAFDEETDKTGDGCACETVEFEGLTAKVVKVDHILGRERRDSGAKNG